MVGPATANSSASPRVPLALQQVFIASQRGDEIEKIEAPKNGLGFKIFQRAWGMRRRKRPKPVRAPSLSSLNDERTTSSRETAADATRKAIIKSSTKASVSSMRARCQEFPVVVLPC